MHVRDLIAMLRRFNRWVVTARSASPARWSLAQDASWTSRWCAHRLEAWRTRTRDEQPVLNSPTQDHGLALEVCRFSHVPGQQAWVVVGGPEEWPARKRRSSHVGGEL